MNKRIIVIAWATEERRPACSSGVVRVDLGERPGWEDVTVGHACVWLNAGTEADVVKAEAHAIRWGDGARVYTYPTIEPDPLARAKDRACRAQT